MAQRVYLREDIFTEGPEGPLLSANKCSSCGQVFFPRAETCLNCLHQDLQDIVLSGQGRLFSFTVVHMPSTHFQPPYAVGFVDLEEGVRVFAPLVMKQDKPFQVGMEMTVQIDTLWQEAETEFVGYRFSPVE